MTCIICPNPEPVDLRPTLHIRPLRNVDTDDVVALYDRAIATEPGIGPVPRAAWERFVKLPHNRDGRDFRIVHGDNRLVGLAESSLKDHGGKRVRLFKLVVEPAMRRQGVGSALLAELLTLDEPSETLSFQSLVSRDWTAGLAFLKTLGFAHIESDIGLRCSSLRTPSAAAGEGASFERVATPSDHADDVARIHNAAYVHDAGFRDYTAKEMAHLLEESELWIARDGARIVGFCHLESEKDLTWLESLAIDPGHQGQGLGTALAYRALHAANVDRTRPAGLTVSSANLRALSIYRRLGFDSRHETYRFSAFYYGLSEGIERRRR